MRPILRKIRWTAAWLLAALLLPPGELAAQDRMSESVRLSSVARGATDLYNASSTSRVSGAYDLGSGKSSGGDVAVLNGPVTVAGTVQGSLVAINADVRFSPGARVTQHLIVIGGTISGQDSATIGGDIRVQAELLRYHIENERLIADGEPAYDDSWWKRRRIKGEFRKGEAYTDFFYVASRTYNRVEGWSFEAGPRFRRTTDWGKINVQAFGVIRTADPVQWDNGTLGHDARAELQFGRPWGLVVGGRAFDLVEPTESWQLSDGEVGLSSALLHRDYRDYFVRHGGEGYLRLQGSGDADLSVSFGAERWGDAQVRDPWSLMRGNEPWRANPRVSTGEMHLLTARAHVDTRDKTRSAWSGWYLLAEWENGQGRLTDPGANCAGNWLALCAPSTARNVNYTRGLLDLRRYNRISPHAFFNMRVVTGGWLGGDPLPLQRRMALGGPGTLPGYGFRETNVSPDMLNCSTVNPIFGTPGFCDRIALAQLELRSRFFSGIFRDDSDDDWWRPGFNHEAQWVLFANAGRGWNVGTPSGGGVVVDKGRLPDLGSFKRDVGIGLDFGGLGFY
jgi:hypothetical protein